MAALANGTDLGGSLRNPASFCGVVGLRPSRVPLDVDGPMGRTVEDVALLLSVITKTEFSPLDSNLKGLRVAWFKDLGDVPFEPEILQVVNSRRKTFEAMGCLVEDAEPDFKGADESFRILRAWNSASKHADRVAFLKATLAKEVERGLALTESEVERAKTLQSELRHRVGVFFERFDAFVLPTVQVLPFPVELPFVREINGIALETYIDWMKSCYYISATGHPAISVPAGFSESGLPIGLQIVGKHRGERRLLEIAYGFEQAAQVRRGKW